MDHQELVFKGAAGLCRRTVRDGPCWCVPSSLHPTAPADHSANFVGRISPSRTLYIPVEAAHQGKASQAKGTVFPTLARADYQFFSSVVCRMKKEARGGEGPE